MNFRAIRNIFLVGIFILAGCSHYTPKPPTGLTPEEFWKEQAAKTESLKMISAKISMHYEGKSESVTGQGRVIVEFPHRIRLELRDPFGKLRYLVAGSNEALVVYYPVQKLAYLDKPSGNKYLKNFLGADLSFQELHSYLLGILPDSWSRQKFETWTWDDRQGTYRGVMNVNNRKVTIDVDGKLATVRKISQEGGNDDIAATYSDFKLCCLSSDHSKTTQIPLAQSVSLQHTASKVLIEVDWSDVKRFEKPVKDEVFHVALPEGVRARNLK